METARPSDHFSLLGLCRFALAIIVVNAHLGHLFKKEWPYDSLPLWYRFGRDLGPAAAIMGFLAISGFSIARSYAQKPDGYYKRRIVRIFPALWTVLGLWFVTLFFWGPIHTPAGGALAQPAPADLLMAATASNGIVAYSFLPPTWSLAPEIWFYVLTPVLARLPGLTAALIIASAALYACSEKLGLPSPPAALFGLSAALLFWAWGLGFIFAYFPGPFSGVALALVGVLLLQQYNYEGGSYSAVTFVFVVAAIAGGGFVNLRHSLVRKVFNYLGDISYPLYLVHYPVIFICGGLFGLTAPWAALAISLACAVGILQLAEKPMRRASRMLMKDRAIADASALHAPAHPLPHGANP